MAVAPEVAVASGGAVAPEVLAVAPGVAVAPEVLAVAPEAVVRRCVHYSQRPLTFFISISISIWLEMLQVN